MIPEEYMKKVMDEVAGSDTYHLRRFTEPPDVIYDLGANVGAFAVFCRELFPEAFLVCVEPDDENFAKLSEVTAEFDNIARLHAAIADGPVYREAGFESGMHHFISPSAEYPPEILAGETRFVPVSVPGVGLPELVTRYGGTKQLIKMDLEGAESVMLSDPRSLMALELAWRVTGELHFFTATVDRAQGAYRLRLGWMNRMKRTHHVEMDVWANGATFWMDRND